MFVTNNCNGIDENEELKEIIKSFRHFSLGNYKGHNNIYIYMVSSQMGQSHDGSQLSDSDHYWWMPDNYTVSI